MAGARPLAFPVPAATPDPSAHADGSSWLHALDTLAELLDGHRWLVAGGLAVPLTTGRFYRQHKDIDIILPDDALGGIDDAMRAGGYRLTTRVCFDLGPRRFTLLLPVRPNGLRLRLRCRKLRFVPRRGEGPLRPTHVDVMPYRLIGGWIAPRNMTRRVPLTIGMEGCRVPLPSGRTVGVLDLHYARALMLRPNTPTHRQDLAVIEETLAYRSRVIGAPPRAARATSTMA